MMMMMTMVVAAIPGWALPGTRTSEAGGWGAGGSGDAAVSG